MRAVIAYVATFAVVYLDCRRDRPAGAANSAAQRNFPNALKLSIYAHTPVWLAGIFLLIPGLHFLMVLGLYGVYLLWTGLPVLMRTPQYRLLPYTMIVAVVRARSGGDAGGDLTPALFEKEC